MTLANRITLARLLGIPVFILMMVYYLISLAAGAPNENYRLAALVLFTMVAVTDALDGYAARSRGEVTELGKVLDPFADKALLVSALILLTRPLLPAMQPAIPVWFTLLLISRDVLLVLGWLVIHHFSGRVHVRPRIVGKIATFMTMVLVIWVLARWPARGFDAVVLVTGFCTLLSGLLYLLDGLRQLEKHSGAPAR